MAKIEELKRKYGGEWLAIEITKGACSGPREGSLIIHSPDHDKVWDKIAKDKRSIYVTYAGPPIEKGYAVAF